MIPKPKYPFGRTAATNPLACPGPVDRSRRRFVQGAAVGAGLLTSGFGPALTAGAKTAPPHPELSGNH